eukprot:Skav226726  [mRNA]  locus=scaffold720:35303:36031:+ [translate_table: standard]
MVRRLTHGEQLSQEQLQSLEASPRALLREEQRTLNQRRKQMNKERGLRQRIEETKTKFKDWERAQRKLMKDEKERYESELQRLEKELKKALKEEEEMDEEEPDFDSVDMNTHQSQLAAMEQRALAAERVAWENQQNMLALQAQMQQVMAYHHANPTQPNAPVEPWTAASPGVGNGTAPNTATSPQLPKRHPTLKTSPGITKGQTNKGSRPAGVAKRDKQVAIDVEDDEPENIEEEEQAEKLV